MFQSNSSFTNCNMKNMRFFLCTVYYDCHLILTFVIFLRVACSVLNVKTFVSIMAFFFLRAGLGGGGGGGIGMFF